MQDKTEALTHVQIKNKIVTKRHNFEMSRIHSQKLQKSRHSKLCLDETRLGYMLKLCDLNYIHFVYEVIISINVDNTVISF